MFKFGNVIQSYRYVRNPTNVTNDMSLIPLPEIFLCTYICMYVYKGNYCKFCTHVHPVVLISMSEFVHQ